MSAPADWLAGRKPPPPLELMDALRPERTEGSLDVMLADQGRGRLDEARGRLGRVRDSAFRLLEADAFITYACEAALDGDDPEAALKRILLVAGS